MAGAAGFRETFRGFFLARDLDVADVVIFFVVFRRVWPSDETAMSDARRNTAKKRSFRYNIILIEYEVST
jgi:hypothetical protein